ncbi:MAG: stage III sporulation protein AD [Oscillospiraceae bacterium]|jgi:stage III sporulation protein AD|nr:stage III sporulation protein AD [Oscillospiraceae bacterium]
MDDIKLLFFAVFCAIFCVVLKRERPEYAFILSIISGIFILLHMIPKVTSVVECLKNLMSTANLSTDYMNILFKCLGICIVAQLSSDSCRDSGQTSLASKVELVGKIMVIIVSLPLFESVIDMAKNLLS